MFILMLSFMALVKGYTPSPYEIERMEHNPGIYYEHQGTMNLEKMDWQVVITVDLHETLAMENDNTTLHATFLKCLVMFDEHKCNTILNLELIDIKNKTLHNLLTRIKTTSRTIETAEQNENEVVLPPSIKVKRLVPLGFVGSASSTLFGLVTNDEVETINRNINQIDSDQKELIHLVNQKTHIITTSFKDLYNITTLHTKAIELIQEQLANRMKQILEDGKSNMYYLFTIISYSRHLIGSLDHYINTAEKLLEIITLVKEGKVHPGLIDNEKMHRIIADIRKNNRNIDIPIPTEYLTTEELNKISNADAIYQGNRLLIFMHIPLVDPRPYHIYKIISLPIPQYYNNKTHGTAYIEMSHNYISLSADHKTYIKFDSDFLTGCTQRHYGYICETSVPLLNSDNKNDCELNMLIRPSMEKVKNCDLKYQRNQITKWHRLLNNNAWLYSMYKESTLTILCPGKQDEITTLTGTGIMRIATGCTGETDDVTLMSKDQRKSKEQYIYKPKVNLRIWEIYPQLENYHNSMQIQPMNIEQNLETEWIYNDDSLKEITARIEQLGHRKRETLRSHEIALWSLISPTTIIITIICIWLTVSKYRKIQRNTESTALPPPATKLTPKITIINDPLNGSMRSFSSPYLPIQRAEII